MLLFISFYLFPFRLPLLCTGDILALSINHLDSLVELPVGCGEQNMVLFAPSIYVLQYLDRSNQDNAEIRSRALGYMNEGVLSLTSLLLRLFVLIHN